MIYAIRADLEARFGASEIERLGDGGLPAGEAGKIDAALSDADAEIDAALAELYVLPLPAGDYQLLTSIACDLARARLYDDAAPEAVTGRARMGREVLAALKKGDLLIVGKDGEAVKRRTFGAKAKGPEHVMTSGNLGGL